MAEEEESLLGRCCTDLTCSHMENIWRIVKRKTQQQQQQQPYVEARIKNHLRVSSTCLEVLEQCTAMYLK